MYRRCSTNISSTPWIVMYTLDMLYILPLSVCVSVVDQCSEWKVVLLSTHYSSATVVLPSIVCPGYSDFVSGLYDELL